jgi:GPI-anchor transamidase subunit S
LPQWGGIVIFNPLNDTEPENYLSDKTLSPIFTIFRNQLLTLLGVPQVPSGTTSDVEPHAAGISDWQLDALLRRRACENTKGTQETLQSIIQLVKQIENMPVGPDVRNDIENSLSALEQVGLPS